jgi:hypothetical protein
MENKIHNTLSSFKKKLNFVNKIACKFNFYKDSFLIKVISVFIMCNILFESVVCVGTQC